MNFYEICEKLKNKDILGFFKQKKFIEFDDGNKCIYDERL